MKINHRVYRGEQDDHRIRLFLRECYDDSHHPYFSVDPPNWERLRVVLRNDINRQRVHLWELAPHPQQKLVALVVYQKDREEYSYVVHPDYQEIGETICGRVEGEVKLIKTDPDDKLELRCSACEGNERQKAVLTRLGYTRGKASTVFRKRPLNEFSSRSSLPPGYGFQDLRQLSGVQVAERATIEQELFGSSITGKALHELQGAPLYRPELDIVITATNGDIAAFGTFWFDDGPKVGFVEPIGTAPAYRQRGLALALLLEGFRRLQKVGVLIVYVGHGAGNSAASHLYDSAGLNVFDQEYLWFKII